MHRANQVICLGLIAYLLIGLIGCSLILLSVGTLLQIIKIPAELVTLTKDVLHLAAFGFLVTMLQTYMLSLPQAVHRFDISNTVDSLCQVFITLMTVLLLFLGYGLRAIIIVRIAANLVSCLSLYCITRRLLPYFKLTARIDGDLIRLVFSYSLISFIGRLGSTAGNYLQTIVVGSVIGVSAVTIFSVPFQLVGRVMTISSRLSTVIFPISSELGSGGGLERLHSVYLSMTRFIFFLNSVQLVVFVLFSWDILYLWMGRSFADDASRILLYIAVGFFFDLLTSLPSQVNDGISSPKVTSTFAFLRGITGVLFAFIGGKYAGVHGVAIGFMTSSILLSVSFNLYVHHKIIHLSFLGVVKQAYVGSILFSVLVLAVLLPINSLFKYNTNGHVYFLCKLTAVLLAFTLYGYLKILDDEMRCLVREKCTIMLRRALPSVQ
jgi:O-antigen/teichoic acid export membrane protein